MDTDVHCYRFPRPSITTDVVAFTVDDGKLQVLLIERNEEPKGWALPGGFLQVGAREIELSVAQGGTPPPDKFDFTLEGCARREMDEETGVQLGALHQIGTFGNANRDPRGRYVTVAFWGFVHKSQHNPKAGSDAKSVRWWNVDALPKLEFDHKEIVALARDAITSRRLETHLFAELMPAQFTYADFHQAFEVATAKTIDRSSLHRRILPFLRNAVAKPAPPTDPLRRGAHRPAILYDKRAAIADVPNVLESENER